LISLENKHLKLTIHEGRSEFDFLSIQDGIPGLQGNHIRIRGSFPNGKKFTFCPQFTFPESEGECEWVFMGWDEYSGLKWKVSFSAPAESPFLLWKVDLINTSLQEVTLDEITLLEPSEANAPNLSVKENQELNQFAFFANGWQSWSSSGAYLSGSRMRRSNLGLLQNPMVINPGTPEYRTRGVFSGDFFGVIGDLDSRRAILLGFLSQKQHFGSLSADLRSRPKLRLWANGDETILRPGAGVSTDWAICCPIRVDDPEPLAPYIDAVAREHAIGTLPPPPAGWCSWYYYYENISPDIITGNLKRISSVRERLPLDLVQIDDGFEASPGDWFAFKPRFPKGVVPLAREIRADGFTPGLWLAPFILHPDSRTAADHPDWLLRRKNGRLARAGFGWNSLSVALDLTVPDALEYACEVIDVAAHQWGFPYLKLDFLYAAAVKCAYHDPTRTRAQVLRSGMEALRRSAGRDTFLLGCGAPLGSVLGLVQAMRIGADVSGSWRPFFFGMGFPFKNEPHMPSARNSIQNILVRAGLHRKWWINDPDCLLVRPDSRLNPDEVRSLATAIGMTGGSVLLSDDITRLPDERIELAAALLPPMQENVQVLDWLDAETPQKLRIDLNGPIGKWHVLAYFNWEDLPKETALSPADFRLPEDDYWVRSFWDQRVWRAAKGNGLFRGRLGPHCSLLLAVRPAHEAHAVYLGSSLHISQGLEIDEWEEGINSLSIKISPGRSTQAKIDLYLPQKPVEAKFEDKPVGYKKLNDRCYRFEVDISQHGRLNLNY